MLKLVESVVTLLTALGIGGLIGAFFQSRSERQKHLEQQEHELKRKRYGCILILMLTKLDPRTGLPHVQDLRPDLRDLDDIEKEIRTELLNAVLFASDDVLSALAEFVRRPDYPSYLKAASAMRRDLWNKKTSIDERDLDIVFRVVAPSDPRRSCAHGGSALRCRQTAVTTWAPVLRVWLILAVDKATRAVPGRLFSSLTGPPRSVNL